MAEAQDLSGPPIRRNNRTVAGKRNSQSVIAALSTADQHDWSRTLNNFSLHVRLMAFWETDHNLVTK
ncbi:hypothetical protein [Sagittula stellata]|uniref:hypothetical protein n=1 Tax=Sagittula stellata TaxID=52603 RepID=UPI002FC2E2EB